MKKPVTIFAAAALAAALGACTSETSTFSVVGSDASKVVVTAENADTDSSGSTSLTVNEGERVVFDQNIKSGKLHVTVTAEGSDIAAIDFEYQGEGTTEYELNAGEYTVEAGVAEKATGTLTIHTEAAAAPAADEPAKDESAAASSDTQNAIMNLVGTYAKDRASILVEPDGKDGAKFLVNWGSSASEHTEWIMSGKFDANTLTVSYDNCVRKDVVFKEDGTTDTETVIYENGKGTFTFTDDLKLTWNDEEEHQADGMVFDYAN